MEGVLVAAYVRADGVYITSCDRTTVGLWMESADWEFVAGADPTTLGVALQRYLQRAPRVVRHPARDEFSSIRAETIGALLGLARVRTWRTFISSATRVSIERSGSITVTPMRRDGHRLDAFEPVAGAAQAMSENAVDALGAAVLGAAQAVIGLDED